MEITKLKTAENEINKQLKAFLAENFKKESDKTVFCLTEIPIDDSVGETLVTVSGNMSHLEPGLLDLMLKNKNVLGLIVISVFNYFEQRPEEIKRFDKSWNEFKHDMNFTNPDIVKTDNISEKTVETDNVKVAIKGTNEEIKKSLISFLTKNPEMLQLIGGAVIDAVCNVPETLPFFEKELNETKNLIERENNQ